MSGFRKSGHKYSKVFLWNAWNVLTRMQRRRKKDKSCTLGDRADKITTGTKLLDIIHESYGFSGDI